MLPAHLEEQRTRVLCNSDAPVYTSSVGYAGTYAVLGVDNSFSLKKFKKNFSIKIQSISDDGNTIQFDLIGVDVAIANALRRILISEIPTMAIEHVHIANNTSVIPDEILASRLGLIPILVDPRKFEMKAEEDDATEWNTLVMTLEAKCTKARSSNLPNAPEKLIDEKVLSGQLKWVPHGQQEENFAGDNRVRPVHPDILIAKLRPGQEISVEMHLVKGVGKDHAKFSPVATAWYRLLPEVELTQPILDDDAVRLVETCPLKVFDIEDTPAPSHGKKGKGTRQAVVARPRDCTLCRECIQEPEWQQRVKLRRVKEHFIFTIESTGVLPAHELFLEALKILMEKCAAVLQTLDDVTNVAT